MDTYLSKLGVEYLERAQSGDKFAEESLIELIRDKYMNRRIGRYMHRNRQVEDEDLRQEFMIGVALSIHKARLDMGDPIEYLIQQGVYRVRSYLRKGIMQNTMQICRECGHITRLHRVGTSYICRNCGSNQVATNEVNDHDEIVYQNLESDELFEDEVMSQMLVDEFEKTLVPNTNMYNLYVLLKRGVSRDNPNIDNYVKEIAKMWGGCSEQNVIQNINKLRSKVRQFAVEVGVDISNGMFIVIDK
jgi:predicted RNA-binding Zn-ribbon protein involved in translation (DUF1610 family)